MKKLIYTKGTEFEQNNGDLAIIDTDFRAGKPIMLNSEDLDAAFMNAQSEALSKIGLDDSLNIFIQEEEPDKKVGLWFQKETSQVDRLLADKDFYQFMEVEADKYTQASAFYNSYFSAFCCVAPYKGSLVKFGQGGRYNNSTKTIYNEENNTWTVLPATGENDNIFGYENKNLLEYNGELYFVSTRDNNTILKVYKFNDETNLFEVINSFEKEEYKNYDEVCVHIQGTPYVYLVDYYGQYAKVNYFTGEMEVMPGKFPDGLSRDYQLLPVGDKIYWFNGSPATMKYIDVTSGKIFDTGLEVPYGVQDNKTNGAIPVQILDNYIYVLSNKDSVPGIWYVNIETEEVSEFIPCDLDLCGASAIHNNKLWGFSKDGQIRVFPLKTKEFEGTCVILIPSTIAQKGLHATEIFACLNFEPGYSVLYSFYNAYLMQDKEVQKVPTYYGNGTEWIKIN